MLEATVLIAAIDSEGLRDLGADATPPSDALPDEAMLGTEEDLLVEEIRIDDLPIDGMCGVY